MSQPYTPEDLSDFGYRIEFGGPEHAGWRNLVGKFWWTWVDPIVGSDVITSEGEWGTAEEATAAARKFMKENE